MLGSHLSIAGGYVNALFEAQRLGMETVQIFVKNQRQWSAPPMKPEDVAAWRDELARLGWTRVVAHASYLVNLASPDDVLWEKSIEGLAEERRRCAALGITDLVVHPGSHMGSGEEAGTARVAAALDEVLRKSTGCADNFQPAICLETTVGGGRMLGGTFEQLAAVRVRCARPDLVGFCLDTCHVTAGGYDMTTTAKAADVMARFEAAAGLATLRCFHLNDSKHPIGSHKDRHEHIGDGFVGKGAFTYLLNHPRFKALPMILETEKGQTNRATEWDIVNLRRLRRMMKNSPRGSGAAPTRRSK